MIIAFGSTEIRDLCEDPSAADAYLGTETAEVFRARLADVRAAVTVEDLPVGNPTTGGEAGRELRIRVGRDTLVVLKANHRRLPLGKNGRVDWERVSYVQVIGVERA